MSEEKLVPKRRFSGFDEEWSTNILGYNAQILTGGTPNTEIKDYWSPKQVPWMSSGEINKQRLNSTEDMISEIGLENSSARWIKKKSILIALAGQGKTRGKVAINNIELTTNQSIAAIIPDSGLYYEFIFQNLNKRYEELRLISSGDGTRGGLNKQLVFDVPLSFPSFVEQQKIGNFFKVLDERIANQERKIAKVKALKAAYLTEMFPQEGETVPKRRFKGFEGEWNPYKLGDKVEFITGLTYSPEDIVSNNGTLVLRSSNIKNNQIIDADNVFVDSSVVNSEQVKIGDIIVVVRNGSRDLIGKNAVVGKDMLKTVIGAFMTGIRSKHFNFNNTLLNTRAFKRQVAENLGATINQITIGMFSNMVFYYPKTDEQQKIGAFFKNIDNQIATEESKLDKLKKMKEAYLEEMFV